MKAALKTLHAVFLVLCLGYLVYAIYREGDAVRQLFGQANLFFIMPALLLWPLGILCSGLFAKQVLAATGGQIRYRDVLAIYLNRIPAKYLPGGVWQTFARAYDLNALGIGKTGIAVLVVYENAWTVILAALFSSVMLLLNDTGGFFDELAMLFLAGIALLVPVALLFRRQPFVLGLADYLAITVTGGVFWLVAGGSFLLYLHGFAGVLPGVGIFTLFANYLFAYVMGFISIFTPQGVGVFELVMTQLTEFSILQTQALILVAGFRIIVLLGDMIAWLVFLILMRHQPTGKSE